MKRQGVVAVAVNVEIRKSLTLTAERILAVKFVSSDLTVLWDISDACQLVGRWKKSI